MDAIWILIAIGYVLFKAMGKKVPDWKDRLPKDWEKGLPRRWEPTTADRAEGRPKVSSGTPGPGRPGTGTPPSGKPGFGRPDFETPGWEKTRPSIPQGGRRPDSGAHGETARPAAARPAAAQPDTDARSGQSAQGWPLMDGDAVVNGIIFSEILKPPRSRQPRNPGRPRF